MKIGSKAWGQNAATTKIIIVSPLLLVVGQNKGNSYINVIASPFLLIIYWFQFFVVFVAVVDVFLKKSIVFFTFKLLSEPCYILLSASKQRMSPSSLPSCLQRRKTIDLEEFCDHSDLTVQNSFTHFGNLICLAIH